MAATTSGTYSAKVNVLDIVAGSSVGGGGPFTWGQLAGAAVVGGQILASVCLPFYCRIGGVQATAAVAGTGAGSTVLDLQINGTSIYVTTANRPTLLATSVGGFALMAPDVRTLKQNDILTLLVYSVSTTGHGKITFSVALER